MKLNTKQQYAFEQIQLGANLFISGPGGVGKSVLVHKIRDLYEHETIFIAPTGIAALNIRGATIHRTFKFPLGYLGPGARKHVNEKAKDVLESPDIKRIVIDEISMVRGDLFTAIDENLRRIRRTNKPFGGLQVIVVGDFYQLSPVLMERSQEANLFYNEFESPFAFDTEAWKGAGFTTIELDEIMRQTDEKFISALNSIRTKGSNHLDALTFLNDVGTSNEEVSGDSLFLCTTNKDADTINQHNYDEVEGEERVYWASKNWSLKDMPAPEELRLKIGAKVLITANDAGETYYNGQTGKVVHMGNNKISVELDRNQGRVDIDKFTWTEFEYDKGGSIKPVGTFVQFPIKLGWAITIHKSQGMSLDEAIIYMGRGAFCHGQTYVGLSRLRSLGGLAMLNEVKHNDIIVDTRVKKFYSGNTNLMG